MTATKKKATKAQEKPKTMDDPIVAIAKFLINHYEADSRSGRPIPDGLDELKSLVETR
jgi:hypothetical protein